MPPELEKLKLPFQYPNHYASLQNGSSHAAQQQMDETESDEGDDIEVESEQDSDGEEDLQLEVDDAHNTSKVSIEILYTFFKFMPIFSN